MMRVAEYGEEEAWVGDDGSKRYAVATPRPWLPKFLTN
jgi:hypothetical protein